MCVGGFHFSLKYLYQVRRQSMCVGGFHFSLKYLYQVRRQSMCVGGFRLDFVTILEGLVFLFCF
jgi:hypothetical protein